MAQGSGLEAWGLRRGAWGVGREAWARKMVIDGTPRSRGGESGRVAHRRPANERRKARAGVACGGGGGTRPPGAGVLVPGRHDRGARAALGVAAGRAAGTSDAPRAITTPARA